MHEADRLIEHLAALEARIRRANRPMTPQERVAMARLLKRLDAATAALAAAIPPTDALGHLLGRDYPGEPS